MAKWDSNAVRAKLTELDLLQSERTIQYATQFTLSDGTVVNCYNTGSVVVQGKDTDIKRQVDDLFADTNDVAQPSAAQSDNETAPTRVFIVYGHDVDAREQLELLLRRLKLDPVVLQNIPSSGDTIIEKLEALTDADYACVLVTPDDEGRKRGDNSEALRPRARQNVVLELGMVLARLGRQRVAVLVKSGKIERPSDIDGLLYIPFKERVDEIKNPLAANLQEAGFMIQVRDLA